ncbi:hypothetical protein L6R52_05380 [Myxococcota bacterium]|nr:hypothetical protein [Myxococcota bacterium]
MQERLSVTVNLTLAGAAHEIPGGDVRAIDVQLTPWGASGAVELVVQDDSARGGPHSDELLADFVKPDLGTIELTITSQRWDSTTASSLPSVQTRGLIIDKSVREMVYERQLGEPSVLVRYYHLRFADPARVLWRQHHPYDLFVQKTLQDVVEAHKGTNITVTYDWDVFTTQRPQIFLGLAPDRAASFHDFVCWLVDEHSGAFTFDHRQGTYTLSGVKSDSGAAATLVADDVESMTSHFPEVARWAPRVVNSYTEAPAQRAVDSAQASAGVFRDVLLDTPIQQVVDDRFTLESNRPLVPTRELELTLRRWSTAPLLPGDLVDVSSKGAFSSDLLASTEPWRVIELHLAMRAIDGGPERSYGEPATGFEGTLRVRLESKSETTVRLPRYAVPRYPVLVEGKVVSETGEAEQITYQFVQDQTTSLDEYRVQVPLFANQVVTVPLRPTFAAGNVYNPLYKDERVLLALSFDGAELVRMLDWRAGARAEQDPQGHQLLLGKTAESNTTILHQYVDDKPVLQLLRTNEKDTQLIQVEEGRLYFQVKEST